MKHPQYETLQKSRKIITKDKDGNVIKVKSIQFNPSKTDQTFSQEVEINQIMDRYTKHGIVPSSSRTPGVYDDFTRYTGLMDALNKIKSAEEVFHSLNKKLQNRFGNPEELAKYLLDEKNYDEAVKLGIFPKRDEPDDAKKEKPDDSKPIKTKSSEDPKKTKSPDEGEE